MPAVDVLFGNRRVVKSPINEMDKSTIVSIYPKDVKAEKITVDPGYFTVPKGSFENPSVLVIGPSVYWQDTGPDLPYIEVYVASVVMADSIVKDFCRDVIESDLGVASPGMFFVPGVHTANEVKLKFKKELEAAKQRQDLWYQRLVTLADVDWARTNGNPLSIMNEARTAAQYLGLDKPWLQDFQAFEKVKCPACGSLYNPAFPLCGSCKTIVNPELFKKLGLQASA